MVRVKKNFISVALFGVFAVSGCSEVQKLDDMHDATIEMNQTTQGMAQSTGEMKGLTEKMSGTTEKMHETTGEVAAISGDLRELTKGLDAKTAEMYDAIKQGDALDARRQSFRAVLEAQSMPRKVSEASKYFMSFEYQLWSGIGHDSAARREELAASAAREFFRDIHDLMEGLDISAPDPAAKPAENLRSDANRMASLNAISVALHIVNPKQEERIGQHKGMESITILSIIEEALKAKGAIQSGAIPLEKVPGSVRETLVYENAAVALLQARMNFLSAMALAQVSDISKGFLSRLGMITVAWEPKLDSLNLIQLHEVSRYLKGTLQVRALLQETGYPVVMNGNLQRVFRNMKVESPARLAVTEAPSLGAQEAEALKTSILSLLSEVAHAEHQPKPVPAESVTRPNPADTTAAATPAPTASPTADDCSKAKVWRTHQNRYCTADYWSGCDRATATGCQVLSD